MRNTFQVLRQRKMMLCTNVQPTLKQAAESVYCHTYCMAHKLYLTESKNERSCGSEWNTETQLSVCAYYEGSLEVQTASYSWICHILREKSANSSDLNPFD
jgi:hypothetical protein